MCSQKQAVSRSSSASLVLLDSSFQQQNNNHRFSSSRIFFIINNYSSQQYGSLVASLVRVATRVVGLRKLLKRSLIETYYYYQQVVVVCTPSFFRTSTSAKAESTDNCSISEYEIACYYYQYPLRSKRGNKKRKIQSKFFRAPQKLRSAEVLVADVVFVVR